jgi:hypothetical protein
LSFPILKASMIVCSVFLRLKGMDMLALQIKQITDSR